MMSKLIDKKGNWIGGTRKLVQLGDILDRGRYSVEVYMFLKKLQILKVNLTKK